MLIKRSLSAIISVAATVTTLIFAVPANAATAASNPRPTPPGTAPGTMATPTVTTSGPYQIAPYTSRTLAVDAKHQANPTFAWLYTANGGAAQWWWESGTYNISGYVGWAIWARYGGHDMCLNVDGNNYAQGTSIAVNACDTHLQVNELWEIYQWPVQGVSMYTFCAAYNPGLCINADGGIAAEHYLILFNLNQLWSNSLWQLYAA